MPIHDWSRLPPNAFHDFHLAWIAELRKALNGGLLPPGYFAAAEQVVSRKMDNADIITLRSPPTLFNPAPALTAAAPSVSPLELEFEAESPEPLPVPRRLAIRHNTGAEPIALIEIVSNANKASRKKVHQFAEKAAEALRDGKHVVILDILPPGRRDPRGMHEPVWHAFAPNGPHPFPGEAARTIASYVSYPPKARAIVGHPRVGDPLPDAKLFLTPDYAVQVPLERTYLEAWNFTPPPWRERLETPA